MTNETKLDKWQNRFMNMAEMVSTWSKDPLKKVGAILVKDRRILATGYNGFPSAIPDSDALQSDLKNHFIIHAEANAILNAGKAGVFIDGSSIYVSGLCPCEDCAKLIIQSGIKEVFYDHNPHGMSKWFKSCANAIRLFDMAGVKHTALFPAIIMLSGKKGSGKSTIAKLLLNYYNEHKVPVEIMSFAAVPKQILATTLGLDLSEIEILKNKNTPVAGGKNMRKLLQTFSTEAMQHAFGAGVWQKFVLEQIKNSEKRIVIIDDWRFPHETISGALKVKILGGDTSDSHISENALNNAKFDIEIDNSNLDLSYSALGPIFYNAIKIG